MKTGKRILLSIFVFLVTTTFAHAFLYEVTIPTTAEIKKLSNDQLVELYTDILIERETSEIFHGKAGFKPSEYQKYKELLHLIVNLRREMAERDMQPPPVEEWLRHD